VKVVITAPWARKYGGGETMLMAFLRSLDKTRFATTVVFFEDGPFVEETRSLGHHAVVLPAGRLRQVRLAAHVVRALARLLVRERPDLLLNWMAKTHLYGSLAAVFARRVDRVVWWQHTTSTRHWLNQLATLLPARAVGCSSRHAAAIQARQWPSRPVFVVHPGIDAPPHPRADEQAALRERLEIPPGRLIVGLVGRLERGKRHDRFLDVLMILRARGLDVHGLLVGGAVPSSPPELAARLNDDIRKRSLASAVTVTGQVEDARPLIALMDVLVSVATSESFGIALVEAMALAVPVVATAGAGPAEIIEPDLSGIIAADARPESVAEAVEKVLTQPQLRRQLQTGGEARYRTRFTAERMTRDLELALTELVAN
jgi:glycosyltransferase involved in cell wall biosynthesis